MYEYTLVILIIGAFLAFRAWQSGGLDDDYRANDDRVVPLLVPEHHDAAERTGFGAIRRADPRFDLDDFYRRVSEMFLAYHAALAAGDLKPVRRFVDERYYADLLASLEGTPRPPASAEPLRVLATRAMTASHDGGMDTVRVLISAASGVEDKPSLMEYWTLIRRTGTLTKEDLSLYKCPNCGGPTDGDDPTRCGYCDARLADPSLDWVVAQIRTD